MASRSRRISAERRLSLAGRQTLAGGRFDEIRRLWFILPVTILGQLWRVNSETAYCRNRASIRRITGARLERAAEFRLRFHWQRLL